MKMNRGRSSDSLDNAIEDIVSSGSSSPTNFTSDDEVNADNLFMISGQTKNYGARSRSNNPENKNLSSIKLESSHDDFILYNRNIPQVTTNRQVLSSSNQNSLAGNQINYIGHMEPSTSYYDTNQPNQLTSNRNFISRLPNQNSISLLPSEAFGPLGSGIDSTLQITSPGQERMFTDAARELCARLVECRSLVEAVELIDQNRVLIDNLVSIVTHDAPAYRNYDLSNYQIDYSVKESFNPHFWHDREPIVTTADGNCQYHAVSISLTGSEDYTQEVRLATAVAVLDNQEWFDSMLKLIDRGSVLDLVRTIARSFSWGDETTLKAVAVAIKRRIFLYTCNIGKKDYEVVKTLSKEELLDAFREKKYRGGTGIHTYADPLTHVSPNNYIMLFHKSEHFIAVLPTTQQPTMFEPYNPIVPVFT